MKKEYNELEWINSKINADFDKKKRELAMDTEALHLKLKKQRSSLTDQQKDLQHQKDTSLNQISVLESLLGEKETLITSLQAENSNFQEKMAEIESKLVSAMCWNCNQAKVDHLRHNNGNKIDFWYKIFYSFRRR
jgi:chromosome segregation ATPase